MDGGLEGASPGDLKRALMRKVAQLTKVVVHLNSRNDEAELRYNKLCANFEDEIQTVLQETSQKMCDESSRLDRITDSKSLTQGAARLDGLQLQRQADMAAEVQALKRDAGRRQAQAVQETGTLLGSLTTEVHGVTQSLRAGLEAYRQVVCRSRAELEQRDVELREKRAGEMKAVQDDYTRRIDDVKAALGREIEHLHQSTEQSLGHIRRLHDSEMNTLRSQHMQKMREIIHRLEQDFGDERRTREQAISHLEFELAQQSHDLSDFQASRSAIEQQVDAMRSALDEMRRRTEDAQADARAAQQEASKMEAQAQVLQSEMAVLQVRQRAEGLAPGEAAPPPPPRGRASAAPIPQVTGTGLAEELRGMIAAINQLEAKLGQAEADLGDAEEELAEAEKRTEILELETEEERLRSHQLQSRIVQLEASLKAF
eukprot:TRINITY_DN78331_c0_g1_i1.p1 TRINITY_DN78331_c0_g1~~TRINITY_DN78331_c0_g1_i1.p1  ORF type:complete len:453 (-),score=110.15 TRINITY_DN78331_c0_g1_i1:151-1437(-)